MKELRLKAKEALSDERLKYGSQYDMIEMLKLHGLDVSQSAYAKWETGERKVSIPKAKVISTVLNKKIHELFELDSNDIKSIMK